MRFTFESVAVHFLYWCCSLARLGKFMSDKKKHKVHLLVCCSAVSSAIFCLMFTHRFGCCKKQSTRISVISKLLSNREALMRVFYMKKLRLIDIFPKAYCLNHFDQRFVKISRKTAAASRRQPYNFQN